MNRILVTGANGFIGSHLVELLVKEKKEDDEIVCMVRNTSDLSNILGFVKEPGVSVIIGDVTKPETLANAVRGATFIFHLGAALKMAQEVVQSGARGMTVGRNIWSDPQITKAVKAFLSVIHDGLAPEEALRNAGL